MSFYCFWTLLYSIQDDHCSKWYQAFYQNQAIWMFLGDYKEQESKRNNAIKINIQTSYPNQGIHAIC